MTFLQIHLAVVLIIEDKMREAGLDPDAEEAALDRVSTPSEIADFFN